MDFSENRSNNDNTKPTNGLFGSIISEVVSDTKSKIKSNAFGKINEALTGSNSKDINENNTEQVENDDINDNQDNSETYNTEENSEQVENDDINDNQDNNYDADANNNSSYKNNFCSNCGAKLAAGVHFCSNCGCKISDVDDDNTLNTPNVSSDNTNKNPNTNNTTSTETSNEDLKSNQKSKRQQEYIGKVYKCPNCGEVVDQGNTICTACGYRLSGQEAIASISEFQRLVYEIESSRFTNKYTGKKGFVQTLAESNKHNLDETDKKLISLIQSYPIPNSIEDIIEFFYLALGNINTAYSKKGMMGLIWGDTYHNRETAISNAWVGKLQQIYRRAELSFPKEPEFEKMKKEYNDIMTQLKMN